MGGGDYDFLAPSSLPLEPGSQRMTNADFCKLMINPRSCQTPTLPTPTLGVESNQGVGEPQGKDGRKEDKEDLLCTAEEG